VEQLGGEGFCESFDGGLLLGCEWLRGQALGGAGELLLADGFGGELELLDGFDGRSLRKALAVAGYFAGDDGFGGFGFPAADGLILRGDLLEVVDVVDEAAFEVVDLGGNVAGDGYVDEEDGAVAAAVQEGAGVVGSEDLAGAGRRDDDVGAVRLLVELVEGDDAGGDHPSGPRTPAGDPGDGRGAEGVGDFFSAGFSAVGDQQRGCALMDEMAGG